MQEFTIHIESPQLNPSGGDLDKVQEYANEVAPDSGAAFLIDHARGVFSATMQIEAERAGQAVDNAVAFFSNALAAAGYQVGLPGWVLKLELTPTVDERERLSA